MTTPTPTPTVTERGRLIALRAAWLFDGTGSALIGDPLVVIDGGTIVAVGSGAPAPDGVFSLEVRRNGGRKSCAASRLKRNESQGLCAVRRYQRKASAP